MKSMEMQGPSKAFSLLVHLEGLPTVQKICCIISYEHHSKFFSQVRTIRLFLYLSGCLELTGDEYPKTSIHLFSFEP